MSWSPISGLPIQYSEDASGTSASGTYLKFYASGTTTPISMATDSTGATTLDKCVLNSLGQAVNGSSAVFIPHVNQKYKAVLYPDDLTADEDTFASAIWVVDGITPSGVDALVSVRASGEFVKEFDTMAAAIAATTLVVGDVLLIKDRANSSWDVVLSSGVTENSYNIVQGVGVGTLSYQLRIVDGIYNAKAFGAVADGTTDDYLPLLQLATVVSAAGKGTVLFPSGDYFIGQYVVSGNGIVDPLTFSSCNGLKLSGYGAKISTKGDFYRSVSTTRGVMGLYIKDCERVLIEGFEIDGNLDLTTTAGALSEPATYGINIAGSSYVFIHNVEVYQFMADGIYVRDGSTTNPRISSKYVYGTNVSSRNNGRQGMSVVQCRHAVFTNCDFSYNGIGTIKFSPQAGVDIEPNRNTATAAPDQMDVNTGFISFFNCSFEENGGSQFVVAEYGNIDAVTLDNCRIKVGAGSTGGSDTLIFDVPNGVIRNCTYTGRTTADTELIYLGYDVASTADIHVHDNKWTFTNGFPRFTNNACTLLFENNRVLVNSLTAVGGTVPFAGWGSKATIKNNYFYVDGSVYTDGGSGDRCIIFNDYDPKLSEGNIFETDLLAAAGDGGTAHFAVDYGSTTIVQGDVFIGAARGTADTFRPVFNGSFNTNLPYNKNLPGYASTTYDPPSLGAGTNTSTTVTVTGAAVGDFVRASFGRDLQGIELESYVSAADTVTVKFVNSTAGTLDLASSTLRVQVTKVT